MHNVNHRHHHPWYKDTSISFKSEIHQHLAFLFTMPVRAVSILSLSLVSPGYPKFTSEPEGTDFLCSRCDIYVV